MPYQKPDFIRLPVFKQGCYDIKKRPAVIAGILAFNMTGTVLAYPGSVPETGNISSINLNNEFSIQLGYANSGGGSSGGGNYSYLYYTPVDKTVTVGWGSNRHEYTYKGGILYYVNGHESWNADSGTDYSDRQAIALGDAADIFGEGITEDEIKDLIANVEGDQTVNGSQTVTG